MRGMLLALALLVGCKHGATSEHVAITDVMPASTTTLLRTRPDLFPMLGVIDASFSTRDHACWKAFEDKVASMYQLQIEERHTSVFVFEGPLPRTDVLACVKETFAVFLPHLAIASDGELTVIDTDMGKVYAAWRGPFVVAGDRQSVTEALAGAGKSSPWSARVAQLGDAPIAMTSTSANLGALFGIPSTGFELVLSDLSRPPEAVKLKGRVVVHCASVADAIEGAGRIEKGELRLPFELPATLRAAIGRIHRDVDRKTGDLVLSFDETTFDGVDWDSLAKLAQGLTATPVR